MTDPRPTVVCICGSTKFKEEMLAAAQEETLAGRIVLMPGVFGHADGIEMSDEVKAGLDELHFRKIDLADEILVVAPGMYIGTSTTREVEYANRTGKRRRVRTDV